MISSLVLIRIALSCVLFSFLCTLQTKFTVAPMSPPPNPKNRSDLRPSASLLQWVASSTRGSVISAEDPAVAVHLAELERLWRAFGDGELSDEWIRTAIWMIIDGNNRNAALELSPYARGAITDVNCDILRATSLVNTMNLATGTLCACVRLRFDTPIHFANFLHFNLIYLFHSHL
jgi:hypothetical protein